MTLENKEQPISEKLQLKLITDIKKIPGNDKCAECKAKNPSWASLDFGVLICFQCTDGHRKLTQKITRVKSTTMDIWKNEWFQIMKNIGNTIANSYWEEDQQQQEYININSDSKERARFIEEKYIKKLFTKNSSILKTQIDDYDQTSGIGQSRFYENPTQCYKSDFQNFQKIVENRKIRLEKQIKQEANDKIGKKKLNLDKFKIKNQPQNQKQTQEKNQNSEQVEDILLQLNNNIIDGDDDIMNNQNTNNQQIDNLNNELLEIDFTPVEIVQQQSNLINNNETNNFVLSQQNSKNKTKNEPIPQQHQNGQNIDILNLYSLYSGQQKQLELIQQQQHKQQQQINNNNNGFYNQNKYDCLNQINIMSYQLNLIPQNQNQHQQQQFQNYSYTQNKIHVQQNAQLDDAFKGIKLNF